MTKPLTPEELWPHFNDLIAMGELDAALHLQILTRDNGLDIAAAAMAAILNEEWDKKQLETL